MFKKTADSVRGGTPNGPIQVKKFAPKNNNFPQKGDHLPSISEHFPRNHFDPPKYVDLRAFY